MMQHTKNTPDTPTPPIAPSFWSLSPPPPDCAQIWPRKNSRRPYAHSRSSNSMVKTPQKILSITLDVPGGPKQKTCPKNGAVRMSMCLRVSGGGARSK